MELLGAFLILSSLSLPTLIIAQQTKCTSSILSGTAAYNDCCPRVGTDPVTLNGKRYKVICDKQIQFGPPKNRANPVLNPIGCSQACDTDPDCVAAYWSDLFSGTCTHYTTVDSPNGQNSVALVPIPPDDEDVKQKVATAVQQCEARKDAECNTSTTKAVKQCEARKDAECNTNTTKAVKQCEARKDAECNTNTTKAVKQCEARKDSECNGKVRTGVTQCETRKDAECENKKKIAVADCEKKKDVECKKEIKIKVQQAIRKCKKDENVECKKKIRRAKVAECKRCKGTGPKKGNKKKPTAPRINGCGAGTVHGPYSGNRYYASYRHCAGQGTHLSAIRISSDKAQQDMGYCVRLCSEDSRCVRANRHIFMGTGMASRCTLMQSGGATFKPATGTFDFDLIVKI